MTRTLWYTDSGGAATSVDGGAAFTFGTAKARTTTRTGIYDNIVVSGLVAAGWTQHNLATRDDEWTSTGESGTEAIYIRTRYDGSEFLYFYVGTKVDGSNNLQGSIGGGTNSFERWDLGTTDQTFDFIFLATKDFAWFNLKAVTAGSNFSANDQFNAFVGNVVRDSQTNNNVLVTTGTASAGTNVSISVSTSDPTSLDYKIGDIVQIVSQASGDIALAETTQIVSVGTNSIEVDFLGSTYASGARIGAQPCPIVRFVGKNIDPDASANWYAPLSLPVVNIARPAPVFLVQTTSGNGVNPITVTTQTAHGLAAGQGVVIALVGGNTAANGTWVVQSTIGTTQFTISATGNGAYTSGGTVTVIPNDLAQAPGFNFSSVTFCSGSTITAQDGFGTGTTANKRTRRFSIRSLDLFSVGNSTVGTIPGIYGYPGSASFYPNDTGTWNRVTPNQRFLMARFNTAGTKNWMLGKSP